MDDLVVSSGRDAREHRYCRNPEFMRIRRGVYLPAAAISAGAPRWETARKITQARAVSLSVFKSSDFPPVLTAEAALALHDLTSWLETTDIEYLRPGAPWRGNVKKLPAIVCNGTTVAAVAERRVPSSSITETTKEVAGILTPPLWAIGVDSARLLHPMAGVVAMSSVLSRLTDFDMYRQRQSRDREKKLRTKILAYIDSLPPFQMSRQTRKIVEIADSGMDTPGEGYVLWLLHCIVRDAENGYFATGSGTAGATHIFTQFEIRANGSRYFADMAIPAHRVIIEFDGGEKVSTRHGQYEFLKRQDDLRMAGWSMIRINIFQLKDPLGLADNLRVQLRDCGVPVVPLSGLLWKKIPQYLLSEERRH